MPAGATYEPIQQSTLGANASSVTLSSLPTTYTDLIIVANLQATSTSSVSFRLNGDSGSNYSDTILYGSPSPSVGSTRHSAASLALVTYGTITSTSNEFSLVKLELMSSAGSTNKTILASVANGGTEVDRAVCLWRSTAAITSITFYASNNFVAGSTFAVYGIKAA